jgi:hypothetical protein
MTSVDADLRGERWSQSIIMIFKQRFHEHHVITVPLSLNEPLNNKNSLFVSLYSISLALAFRNIENFKDVSQLSIFSYK